MPSLRDWLTRKQRETRRGRAELRLAERAAAYAAKPDARFLPSWWEWPNIRLFTRRRNWTPSERRLMRAATRHHLSRAAAVFALAAAITFAVFAARARMIERQQADQAGAYVKRLLSAETGEVAGMLPELETHRRFAEPELASVAADTTRSPKARLHAALAVLPFDATQATYLGERLLSATPAELKLIRLGVAAPPAELVARLWEKAVDESAAEGEPFRAAAALAAFDPDHDRWRTIAGYCAEQLIAQDALHFVEWLDAFAPVGRHLVPQLVAVIRDELREPAARTRAANALAVYSADDPSGPCQAIVNCEPEQFEILLPVLAKESNRERSVSLLNDVMGGKAHFWDDAVLDRTWPLAPANLTKIETAGGFVAERFAFCLTLPLADFAPLAAELSRSGYRPMNFRPYYTARGVQVAALWTRDGALWRTADDCTQEQLVTRDKEHRELGLVPLDVTVYLTDRDQALHDVYAAVWGPPEPEMGDYSISFGFEYHLGNILRTKMSLFLPEGMRYCAVNRKRQVLADKIATGLVFPRHLVSDSEHYDSSIGKAEGLYDLRVQPGPPQLKTTEWYTRQRQGALADLDVNPDNQSALDSKAYADLRLGDAAAALTGFDKAAATKAPDGSHNKRIPYFRAIALIQLGRREEARTDAGALAEAERGEAWAETDQLRLAALIAAEPQEVDAALLAVEQHAVERPDDAERSYQAACTFAMVAEQAAARPADAARYRRRGIEQLRRAVAAGYRNMGALVNEPSEIGALRGEPDFIALVDEVKQLPSVGPNYEALAIRSAQYDSCEAHGLAADLRSRVRELARDNWRPVSVSAALAWRPDEAAAIVLQRPTLSSAARPAAAAALVGLNAPETAWPLLIHSPRPDLRTDVIHRLAPLGVDPKLIIERLFAEPNVAQPPSAVAAGAAPKAAGPRTRTASASEETHPSTIDDILFDPETSTRRALLLALGEYSEKQLSATERESLLPKLAALYREHPDAGVHAACRWLIHRWGHGDMLAAIDAEVATSGPREGWRWYVNRQGQTFSVIQGPVECFIGKLDKPLDQPGKVGIIRSFAASATEVTLSQIRKFRNEHDKFTENQPDSPVEVSWYDAAAYCNWLSEQEGLDKDQWCYEPNAKGEYGPGMRPTDGFLDRRLSQILNDSLRAIALVKLGCLSEAAPVQERVRSSCQERLVRTPDLPFGQITRSWWNWYPIMALSNEAGISMEKGDKSNKSD